MGESTPVHMTDDTPPPPRALQWFVWLLVIFVILAILGGTLGVIAFREWVPPRYQVAYSERFPILKVLLPARPAPDTTLPTPVPQESTVPLEDLLGGAVVQPDAAAVTPETEIENTPAGDAAAAEVAVQPSPTPTLIPTQPPTQAPTPTPALAVSDQPVSISAEEMVILSQPPAPPSARNFGFTYVTQTWNNCGPANVTMSLSYYGWQEPQTYAERYLRGGREDKNVSPHEIVDFVNEQTGVRALWRLGGDQRTLKHLLAAGFPVMIELGYAPEGNDWLGHYQTVAGYDDAAQSFYVFDSYIPSDQGLPVNYTDLDRNWQQFNRTFIVYYLPEREGEVMSILGPLATEEGAYQVALETAQREAREHPENGFTWFNIGRAQTHLGNYEAAAAAFDQARMKDLPWRILWYQFEPFEAYFETGRYSDVLALVDSNETTLGGGFVEETYYWEGRVLEAQGNPAGAASSFRRALQQNSRFEAARIALEQIS